MKVGLVSEPSRSDRLSPIMQEMVDTLESEGISVEQVLPDRVPTDLGSFRPDADLYVLKSGTPAVMAFSGLLDLAGSVTLNPYPIVARMKDKVFASRILLEADVPFPQTVVAAEAAQLSAFVADGPIVVKPIIGSKGAGVTIVRSREDLDEIRSDGNLLFAQRYHEPDGRDYKIYSIGGELFGVRRVWPARTYEEKLGEPFELSHELREIADRCGRAFGVDLFGLDVVMSDGAAYVVDVNTFPGFKGVPEAGRRLAEYVSAACARIRRNEPVVPESIET